jgi:hypothetical protein
MHLLKSFIAVIVGLTAGTILSVVTDMLLVKSELFDPSGLNHPSHFVITAILLYRFIFNITGCYLTARLAPGKPMQHALVSGTIGFLISITGAVLMWNQAPHYYNIILVLTALPAAWIGGKRYMKKSQREG